MADNANGIVEGRNSKGGEQSVKDTKGITCFHILEIFLFSCYSCHSYHMCSILLRRTWIQLMNIIISKYYKYRN